ncbi:MAG TPA: DUF5915 domain-containing protein [Anaerolineales bacterium]
MPEKIYFQWQNDTLLKSIYPFRLEKLRDFLVHFEEIELWKKNKKMPARELERWKKKYVKKQEEILVEIVKTYNEQKDYFLYADAVALYEKKYPGLKNAENAEKGEDGLERIRNLHKAFKLIDPENSIYGKDIRKEKIFVAQRLIAWEEYRRKVNDRIFRQKRRVNSINENIRAAEKEGSASKKEAFEDLAKKEKDELDRLENQLLKMVDDEMARLTAFSSSYTRYEKRKLAVQKNRENQQAKKEEKSGELIGIEKQTRQLENELHSVQGWLRRFNNVPSDENLEALVKSTEAVVFGSVNWDDLKSVFGKEDKLLDRFIGSWEYLIGMLKFTQGYDVKLTFVRRLMENFDGIKTDIDRQIIKSQVQNESMELSHGLETIVSKVLMPVMEKMVDYQFALERKVHEKTDYHRDREKEYQTREKEIQASLKKARADLKKKQDEFKLIEAALAASGNDDAELVKFVPEKEITVKDIVMEMANEYRETLVKKTHKELLEIIVKKFWDYPEKYPLWLQYMVIHFSGMRYASAHGSWADPKELLGNLLASKREDENRALVGEDEVETQAQTWLRYLQSDGDQVEVEGEEPIILPLSKFKEDDKDGEKKKGDDALPKIDSFVAELTGNFYTKRKALYNLKMLQDKFRIEAMSHQDVLEALKDIREEPHADEKERMPDWMWNEIVAMTDLRIQEAQNPNWEKLTPEQEVEKNSGKWEKYRAIMNKWKAENLTDWRKEHETSGQLIVTRAVCNEVAEHIQHLRGHEGAAGLTEKPNWYNGEEREFKKKWPRWKGERPYFKRPRLDSDFKEGASLLWLRYVRDFPNEWRIALPMDTEEGDGLIRADYLRKRAPGNWTYSMENGIPRKRVSIDGAAKPETQYLRWMHEATVAVVAETAEGTVVLTFETNLPYEDRRLATIGVFKRYPHDLKDDFGEDGYNPAFVGFMPEGELSEEKLEIYREMLDWNKILCRKFKPQAELKAYQDKHIRSKAILPTKEKEGSSTTVVSILAEKNEWAPLPPKTELYKALNWGDKILVEQAGLSALAKTDDGRTVGSNFNPLPIFSNSGTWSAIVNALILPREDVDGLIDLQEEDEYTVREKMNWLVYEGNNDRPYWCKGQGDWKTAKRIWWGTIVFGGQWVLTDGDVTFFTQLPQEKSPRDVPMKRLVCFRKSDWGKTHHTHPWLVHRATQVDDKDRFSDEPRGIIYSPLWSPLDWKFAGNPKLDAFYIPTDWLEPYQKGLAREFVRRVQGLRKKAGLKGAEHMELFVEASPTLKSAIEAHQEFVTLETLASSLVFKTPPAEASIVVDAFDNETVKAGVVKKR